MAREDFGPPPEYDGGGDYDQRAQRPAPGPRPQITFEAVSKTVLDTHGNPAFSAADVQVTWERNDELADESDLRFFLSFCRDANYHPFNGDVTPSYRWNTQKKRNTLTPIVSINVMRRRRMTACDGMDPVQFTYTKDGQHLLACTFTLYRKGCARPFVATVFFDEVAQTNRKGDLTMMWAEKGHMMLQKCFSPDTEVLTDSGFVRFPDVVPGTRILQVTDNGLVPHETSPFVQDYSGPMVVYDNQNLDFRVTPNHDMVTTKGVISAAQLYDEARQRPQHFIPRCAPNRNPDLPISDAQIQLAAAFIADGHRSAKETVVIEVSRAKKIQLLNTLNLHKHTYVRDCAGETATASSGRTITTTKNKTGYAYDRSLLEWVCSPTTKCIEIDTLLRLSERQARLFIDTLVFCDGNTNRKSGVKRLQTSRPDHRSAFEVAAVVAGYAISPWRTQQSDIGGPSYVASISRRAAVRITRSGRAYHNLHQTEPGQSKLRLEPNESGKVWCVTVPSGQIVVRRNGFSFICGNCAEAACTRMGFLDVVGDAYIDEEMQRAEPGPHRPASGPSDEYHVAEKPKPAAETKPQPQLVKPEPDKPAATTTTTATPEPEKPKATNGNGTGTKPKPEGYEKYTPLRDECIRKTGIADVKEFNAKLKAYCAGIMGLQRESELPSAAKSLTPYLDPLAKLSAWLDDPVGKHTFTTNPRQLGEMAAKFPVPTPKANGKPASAPSPIDLSRYTNWTPETQQSVIACYETIKASFQPKDFVEWLALLEIGELPNEEVQSLMRVASVDHAHVFHLMNIRFDTGTPITEQVQFIERQYAQATRRESATLEEIPVQALQQVLPNLGDALANEALPA